MGQVCAAGINFQILTLFWARNGTAKNKFEIHQKP